LGLDLPVEPVGLLVGVDPDVREVLPERGLELGARPGVEVLPAAALRVDRPRDGLVEDGGRGARAAQGDAFPEPPAAGVAERRGPGEIARPALVRDLGLAARRPRLVVLVLVLGHAIPPQGARTDAACPGSGAISA